MSGDDNNLYARLGAIGEKYRTEVLVSKTVLPPKMIAAVRLENEKRLRVALDLPRRQRGVCEEYMAQLTDVICGRDCVEDAGYSLALARADMLLRMDSRTKIFIMRPCLNEKYRKVGAAEVYCTGLAFSDPLLYELTEIVYTGTSVRYSSADIARRLCRASLDLPTELKISGKTPSELLASDSEFIRGIGFRLVLLTGELREGSRDAFVREAREFVEKASRLIESGGSSDMHNAGAAAVLRLCAKLSGLTDKYMPEEFIGKILSPRC